MPENTQWRLSKVEEQTKQNTEDIRDLVRFKERTLERLKTIFEKLKELQEGDRWIKRMFITALTGSILSVLGALLVWALQR